LIQTAVLLAAVVIGGLPSSPEAEPTACWKTLFMDWGDGQVGGTYPLACYRTAIARVERDRLTYGSAAVDLRLLLNRSVAHLPLSRRATLAATTPIVPWPERPSAAGVGSTWTWQNAVRIVFAAVLAALLLAWVVARVRRSRSAVS
jgi:hypothetical protein